MLSGDPDAVPTARRFTVNALRDSPFADLVDDAAMVVTELLTNALLHAGPPVRVRLAGDAGTLRIEVQDPGHALPRRGTSGEDSMTGRGLTVVDTLAHRWGSAQVPGGKVVWCELGSGAHIGRGAPAPNGNQVWADVDQGVVHTLDLGDVPTYLVRDLQAHVENVARELVLAMTGAAAGNAQPLPARLVNAIEAVQEGSQEERTTMRRRLVGSPEAGPRTRLRVTLPVDAARVAQAYLEVLEEADAYARSGRMLTLETTPQQRVFRRWYVESIVAQLSARAAGEPLPEPETFEARLLAELGRTAAAHRAAERTARLQQVTASLAAASTAGKVARVVVQEGVAVLGASAGSLFVPHENGHGVEVLGAVGYPERAPHASVEVDLPAQVALRTAEPVWVRSVAERDERFPRLAELEPETVSACAVPLVVSGRLLGAIALSFEEPQAFDDHERAFLVALAAQTAQALDRTSLHRAEQQARAAAEALARRLERLQNVTAEMAGAADVEQVGEIVVTHLADVLGAQITSLAVVEGDVLRTVRLRGASEGAEERWRTFPVDAHLPASEAVRTRETVVVPDLSQMGEWYPLLANQPWRPGSLVCLPLIVGQRAIGAVSLTFPDGLTAEDPAELRFLRTMADTCAQALDRAQALAAARDSTAKLALLAEASAVLASARGYRETLARIAGLVVPQLADWCSITVVENGSYRPVAVAHSDPERVAWAKMFQEQHPVDPEGKTGVPQVVRTGQSELYPVITDEMLLASAVDEERLRVARSLNLSSAVIVPLTGRAGTFGAISMFHAESGRHYGPEDLALIEDLARRAAVAVDNAREFELQKARLASISRVAEVAQHAILAPIPSRSGRLLLAGAYVSASRDALVGGDHYEVVKRGDGVRLLIGDVRGKGLEAVRLATVVLGLFRAAAVDHGDLRRVARQMDDRLRPYLGDEDFVTALLVDVAADGMCTFVNCGHPSPVLARDGELAQLDCPPTVPLGLGAQPDAYGERLSAGDRLLLFTDGLIERRDPRTGEFVPLDRLAAPLTGGELAGVLGNVLAALTERTGRQLDDDLAMLAVEYAPEQSPDYAPE